MPSHGATPDHKRRRKIAELRAKGLSCQAIGKRLGVTYQSVVSIIKAEKQINERKATCKECGAVIARGRVANKTAQDTFCIPCLAKHPNATFGERLKTYRVAANLMRRELAKRAGVARHVIEGYEMGLTGDPQWSKVRRLAQVVGVGLVGLEGLTDSKRQTERGCDAR